MAKRKAAAANEDQASIDLALAAIPPPDDGAEGEAEGRIYLNQETSREAGELIYLDQEATAIFKYLRGKAQPAIDAAVGAVKTLRVGDLEREVQKMQEALAAKQAQLNALNGVEVTEGANPTIKRARGPNKPRAGVAATIDEIVKHLKDHKHISVSSAAKKKHIAGPLGLSNGQWGTAIKAAKESGRVADNKEPHPTTKYYATGK